MVGITGTAASKQRGGMFSQEARTQYAALGRLRWRMFMNGLRSIHGLLDLGATGIAWLLYSVYGLGLGTGLWAAAYSLASHASWQNLPILFWAISFIWLMFPVMIASFQEQSDLEILLRFPLHFGSFFLLHLMSSLMEASTLIGVLCCFGVWLGIVMARPDLYLWTMLALGVLAVFNVLLVSAVFAWIDRWLAQRKTREILGAVFMLLFVSLLVFNSFFHQKHFDGSRNRKTAASALLEAMSKYSPLLESANSVQQWLPPGVGARALQKAINHKSTTAVASLNMLALWAVLTGGALAGRLNSKYRGQNLNWASSRGKTIEHGGEWTLGGSHPVSAIFEKELRSLMRSMPLLWALSVPVLAVLVLAGMFHHVRAAGMRPLPYAYLLCLAYALLGFTRLFYNNLGTEGTGIQLLFLSPTPIRATILAKNLLHSILFVLVGFVAGALACIRLGTPPIVVLADIGAWLIFALPCNLAAGIIFSLAMPYRIHPGRITRPSGSQANALPAMLIQGGVLGVGVVVLWICGSFKKPWLALPIFLALAVGAFLVWTRILNYAEDNAEQRRDLLVATLMKTE